VDTKSELFERMPIPRALAAMGVESDAVCVLGGFTGSRIKTMLAQEGVVARIIASTAETRINVAVSDTEMTARGAMCEINTPLFDEGLRAKKSEDSVGRSARETAEILAKVRLLITRLMKKNEDEGHRSAVVFAGSIPSDMPRDTYAALIRFCADAGAITVCDCDGDALRHALGARPDFIKPNLEELSTLTERHLPPDQIPGAALELSVTTGSRTAVLTTAGADGAYLCRDRQSYFAPAVRPSRIRTLKGAGDTFLAAFLYCLLEKEYGEEAAMAAAARAASKKIAAADGKYPDLSGVV